MIAISVLAEKLRFNTICFYLTESGGTSDEVAVMAMEQQPPVNINENE